MSSRPIAETPASRGLRARYDSSPNRGYEHPFSGKINPVTPTFDTQKQFEAPEPPADAESLTHSQFTHSNAPRQEQALTGSLTEKPLREVGGRDGPEPTRFGDWELRGRCIDF